MKNLAFKNALISVSDKSGLIEFVKPLAAAGMRIVSSGGTAKHLQENGIEVVQVNEQTGFPEVMDGRVKTLHPNIHMALLARDEVPADMQLLQQNQLEPFDLVIGNLYPFEKASQNQLTDQELVEYIDIGGPSLLRAAAKNYQRITVICEPADYQWITAKGEITFDDRKRLAAKVFSHVSAYDGMIAAELSAGSLDLISIGGDLISELRYGENPQQNAVWKRRQGAVGGLHDAEILQGKALSYNNILDVDAAVATLRDLSQTEKDRAVVAVKHNNPCGIGVGSDPEQVVDWALKADPVSVFGGIVALNFTVTGAMAERLGSLFLECVVAPNYEAEALSAFAKKKNLRVLRWPEVEKNYDSFQIKTVTGGYLVQNCDSVHLWTEQWKVIGSSPEGEIKKAVELAWRACAHLKSNAIAISSPNHTVGMGMGQVNRVDAVDQAIARWKKHHASVGPESVVLASDAFFPFADSVELIANAGIKWVVQPGGSIRDDEVFAKAKDLGVNLIITGQRHFKH